MFASMNAESAAVWSERIEEWERSGKSAPEFAAGKPYKGSTLVWAKSRLRRGKKVEGKRASRGSALKRSSGDTGKVRMAEVIRRAPRADVAESLVVDIAGARISVHRGFDTALLRAVVHALRVSP
jgi:hypothetical protein